GLPEISGAEVTVWCKPFQDASKTMGMELSPETVTRFLCGINTPLMTRVKASKMQGFGKLAQYPFQDVKNMYQSFCID
ncbi:recombinase RecQ, partial [Enterovibrio nigricans]